MTKNKIIIIGGGLTGLTLAYRLKQKGISALIIEARERLGGRILTNRKEQEAPLDMGATWLGKKHQSLFQLLEELEVSVFEQKLGSTAIYEAFSMNPPQIVQLPPNDAPNYRIAGGSSTLIDALDKQLEKDQIKLGEEVSSIEEDGNQLLIKTSKEVYSAERIVSTLPPYLFYNKIKAVPELPDSFRNVASETHTWMGESIKIGLTYKRPFWREGNLSGTIVSNVGPIPEMYDHANVEEDRFSLIGFFNGGFHLATKAYRLELILQQLRKYYGNIVEDYISYEEKVWRKEPFTFTDYQSNILPHQNNGHPALRQPFLNGKLFIAGSETAPSFPGYMDGAVESANMVAEQLIA